MQNIAKILITGATGFVGSHILETLMSLEHNDIEIVAACRNASKLIPQYSGEVRVGDLRDQDYLDRVLAGIDIICHAAGWSSFENSGKQSNVAYLEPTMDLINRAIEWRVSRFVNLSSIFVSTPEHRNNANIPGKPRSYWPMMNCLIAVENFLHAYAQNNAKSRCQFVNLRLGVYSGKRLNMGLLPLLLAQSQQVSLPYINGKLGQLPIVDGRDIGQAFARAALAACELTYHSVNITGPNVPSQAEIMSFIEAQMNHKPMKTGLPSGIASPFLWLQGKIRKINKQSIFTRPMLDMIKNPQMDNNQAQQLLGYDPEISWQASLLNTLELYKNHKLNHDINQADPALNII